MPLREPLRTARGEVLSRHGFVVRIAGQGGLEGLGEASPLPPWTEDLKACGGALEAAAVHLDGPVEDPEEALSDLDAFCKPLRGAPAARHGLALALLDLAAQQAQESLAAYLARTRLARPLAPHQDLEVHALIGAIAPEEAAAHAADALQRGYRCVKLKLAGTAAHDLARVAAVRKALGEEPELRLDANGAWSLAEARARLAALRPHRPAFVEQPTPPGDLAALAALRGAGVPIAADEAAATVAGAQRVLEAGAADVLIVKPHALGGPDRAAEVLALAERARVPAIVTSLLDGPLGTLGARHTALLLPAPRPACGVGLEGLFDGIPAAMRAEQGRVPVPSGPGLGWGAAP